MNEKAPRKVWACPKERKAHYAKQYQVRMAKEDSPQGERWRQKRREESRRSRAKKAAKRDSERIRAMAERVAKDNAAKRAKRRPFDQAIQPRTLQATEAAPAKPVLMSSDEWIAQGNRVEVLPVNWQTPIMPRRPAMSLY